MRLPITGVVALRCSVLRVLVRWRRSSAVRTAVVLLLRWSGWRRVSMRTSSVARAWVVVLLAVRRARRMVAIVLRRGSCSVHGLGRTGIARRVVRLVELVEPGRAAVDGLRRGTGRCRREAAD